MNSEASVLLRHPNPKERALALKLNGIRPHDVAVAILDPDHQVFTAAFNHHHSAHALDVLASAARDAAGNLLDSRHDLLLADPRCTNEHVEMMHRAVGGDTFRPIHSQSARLLELGSHRLLHKSMGERLFPHYDDFGEKEVGVSQEPPVHSDLAKVFNEGIKTTKPLQAEAADLAQIGKSSKVVYDMPGEHRFIVKPYLDEETPLSGWNESTSQHLYNAAGIGRLHQKSFVSKIDNGDRDIPVTVIHVEKSFPSHLVDPDEVYKKNPLVADDARKIAVMDFLSGNKDRHTNNLMVRDDGTLFGIDHGKAFSYEGNPNEDPDQYIPKKRNGTHFYRYSARAPSIFAHADASEEVPTESTRKGYHQTIKDWWPGIAPDVRRAFEERLELVKNPMLRRHLGNAFMARYNWLNNAAKIEPDQFVQELKKALDVTEYDYDDPPLPELSAISKRKYPGWDSGKYERTTHKELMANTLPHVQKRAKEFEKHVNHPVNPVSPYKDGFTKEQHGIEPKSLVQHAGNTYLIKGASSRYNPLSGWGELTSQAMYHAGGIGRLHQDVHATNLHIKDGDDVRTQPVIVVHFRPGKWKPYGFMSTAEQRAVDKSLKRKVMLMDFLTGNEDRHSMNLFVDSNNNLQTIDQAFAFRKDNHDHPEYQESQSVVHSPHSPHQPFSFNTFLGDHDLATDGTRPDEQTYKWWKQNKKPMIEAFEKHLDMLPNKAERDRRRAVFQYRVNAIDNKHPALFGEVEQKQTPSRIESDRTPVPPWSEGDLEKKIGDAEFLHEQHTAFPTQKIHNLQGLHEKLMKAHPPAVSPGVRHFELAINGVNSKVAPTKKQGELQGIQPKAVYSHNGKGYLVKPAIESSTRLGAWNELTSQSLYHAGGIGHLHQKVHATVGKTGANDPSPAHALAIHMAPGAMSYYDAGGWTERTPEGEEIRHPGKDLERAKHAMWNPENLRSLGKIGVMDYLTSNPDRHGHNIMLNKDGTPLAIDHSRAFWEDRKHALGNETEGELNYKDKEGNVIGSLEQSLTSDPEYQHRFVPNWEAHQGNSEAAGLGTVDQSTVDWWNENKEPIMEKFKEHVSMLPNANMRQKLLNSFAARHGRVEQLLREHINPARHVTSNGVVSGTERTLPNAVGRTLPSQVDVSMPTDEIRTVKG